MIALEVIYEAADSVLGRVPPGVRERIGLDRPGARS
jgi:hypothetical protein